MDLRDLGLFVWLERIQQRENGGRNLGTRLLFKDRDGTTCLDTGSGLKLVPIWRSGSHPRRGNRRGKTIATLSVGNREVAQELREGLPQSTDSGEPVNLSPPPVQLPHPINPETREVYQVIREAMQVLSNGADKGHQGASSSRDTDEPEEMISRREFQIYQSIFDIYRIIQYLNFFYVMWRSLSLPPHPPLALNQLIGPYLIA